MRVSNLIDAMEQIAPAQYAEDWDNVGLLVGAGDAPLTGPILLTIDLTPGVLEEAMGAGVAAIVAYHPPIWTPLKRLTTTEVRQRIVLTCAARGIAIYSPHTALDAAPASR